MCSIISTWSVSSCNGKVCHLAIVIVNFTSLPAQISMVSSDQQQQLSVCLIIPSQIGHNAGRRVCAVHDSVCCPSPTCTHTKGLEREYFNQQEQGPEFWCCMSLIGHVYFRNYHTITVVGSSTRLLSYLLNSIIWTTSNICVQLIKPVAILVYISPLWIKHE